MALPETIVWTFILYMLIPLVVLLIFWIVGLVRDARKRAKKKEARSKPDDLDANSG